MCVCVTPPTGVDKYRDRGKLIRDVVAHCLKRVFTGRVRESSVSSYEKDKELVGLRVAVDVDYEGGDAR